MLDDDKLLHRHPSKERLREYIIGRIKAGVLSPGDPLVSGKRLSEMLGMSMRAVRSVLQQLEDEGWIYRKHRVGTFVAEREHVSAGDSSPAVQTGKRVVLFQPTPLDGLQEMAFYAEFSQALDQYLAQHGIELDYSPPVGDRMERYAEREADSIGAAIVAWRQEIYGLVRRHNIPCIGLVDLPDEDMGNSFDGIAPDNVNAACEATNHLIELGHTAIGHIGGAPNMSTRERAAGYRKAMEDAGLSIVPESMEQADWRVQGGYEAMLRMLAKGQDLTAVFCANDMMAFGAVRAIHETGRRVPRDISIVGFDDWELATHSLPPLTTMRVDRARMGQLAGQLALKRLAEPRRVGRVTRIPATLVLRGSTASARSRRTRDKEDALQQS